MKERGRPRCSPDEMGIVIVCCYVDLSLKRIRTDNTNEIIVAAYLDEHQKCFTLARVIVLRDRSRKLAREG